MVIGLKVCFTDTEGTADIADIADIADTAAATENISLDNLPLRQAPQQAQKSPPTYRGGHFVRAFSRRDYSPQLPASLLPPSSEPNFRPAYWLRLCT